MEFAFLPKKKCAQVCTFAREIWSYVFPELFHIVKFTVQAIKVFFFVSLKISLQNLFFFVIFPRVHRFVPKLDHGMKRVLRSPLSNQVPPVIQGSKVSCFSQLVLHVISRNSPNGELDESYI